MYVYVHYIHKYTRVLSGTLYKLIPCHFLIPAF
uniref:Uncharacterized protein n=1 Tax=Anguilla anguilla TaxID=7936 RepID=A0A0E9T5I9_ANGAN